VLIISSVISNISIAIRKTKYKLIIKLNCISLGLIHETNLSSLLNP
jgi:hypothetical protein